MQDQNNENTLPSRVQSTDSTQNSNAGETRPVRLTSPQPAVKQPVAPTPISAGDDPASNRPLDATRPVIAQTQPIQPGSESILPAQPPPSEPPSGLAHPRRWPWFLIGFVIVLIFGSIGGYLGYQAAIDLRKSAQVEQVVTQATRHFMLGLEAQQQGQYTIARQQFEYVISLDPNFPGVAERLAQVMMAQISTQTPTVQPTPTVIPITPTPDLRSQEEIFNVARAHLLAQEWDKVLESIDALRTIDPGYRSIESDGMLYMALRFRGIRKIYQEANLEGGIYDLALAERYAPLDGDAYGARTWARLYLNGVSFWGADWKRVVDAFEQIYPAFPNLRDSTGKTAVERYREAAIEYARVLDARDDGCGALEYYNKALAVAPDGVIEQRATEAYLVCYPPTETPTPSFTPTPSTTVSVIVIETTPVPVETTPAPVETTPVPSETATTGAAP
jgi:tetratricopeptide (TPR) repeat protein